MVAFLEKKHHFDTLNSSMSAVVQELYAELPVALSAERTALSDPKIVLDAHPKASAFVLSCSSDLPSEHQRSYGLKICSQDSDERLDCAGKISCPETMELIAKEPTEAGDLAEDAETQSHLNQEEKEFISRSLCAEIAGLLQNLDESPANMQVTTENLPNSMKEAQGMKADGTRLFTESNSRVSTGVPPESNECSNVDNVMAKVEVSETSTLFSHKPVNVMDNATSEEHLQKENERQESTACTALSATIGPCALSDSEAVDAILNDNLPFQLNEKNFHNNVSVPVLESLVADDDQLSATNLEASSLHFKSCLESGSVLWEENMKISEVICGMQEHCPPGKENNLKSNSGTETIELLEEWAPDINMKKIASPVRSSDNLSSDDEQEMGICIDHSYSNICKENFDCQASEEHLENDTRPVFSETDNTQKEADQLCAFLSDGCMSTKVEGKNPFLLEISKVYRQETSCGYQSSSVESVNSAPSSQDSSCDDTTLCQKRLPKIESSSGTKEGILNSASATHLHITSATSTIDTDLVVDEENNERSQVSGEHSFTHVTLSSAEFLDSLPGEGFAAPCAKLQSGSTDCELHHRRKLPSENHKCGNCILPSVPCMLNDEEKRATNVAATTNTEEVNGQEMSCAFVPIRIPGLLEEYGVKGCDSPPNERSFGPLDGTDVSLYSVCSMGVSSRGLSLANSLESSAEAEKQRADDGGGVNAKEILNVNIRVYPPDTNLKQELIKASLEVNNRVKMMERVKVYKNDLGNNMNEKSTSGSGLDTIRCPLKSHHFAKKESQEELEKYQTHPSSFSDVSSLISDHLDCTKQQNWPIMDKNPSRRRISDQALVCQDYHVNSLDTFNRENVTPQEMRVLACQRYNLIMSKKQMEDNTVQTVNHSLEEAQRSVIYSQDEFICPKRDKDLIPQTHPVLLIKNGFQGTFQPSMQGSRSFSKKTLVLISNPLKVGLIELNHAGIFLECLGRAFERLKPSRFIHKRGPHKTTEFCSVLQSVRRRSLKMRNKCFLKFRSKPKLLPDHISFLLNSMFTTAGGQRTVEGVCSKFFKDSFICISLGAQRTRNLTACFLRNNESSTSLSLNVFDPSAAAAAALERKADDHIRLKFSKDGKLCCSIKGVVCVDSSPGSKEICASAVHSMPGIEVIGEILSIASCVPEPSKKIKRSSDNNQSECCLITEKTKIPIHLLSNSSSGTLLDLFCVAKEDIIIPFKSEIHIRPPFDPLECISELSLNEGHTYAKEPSKTAVVKRDALLLKDVFPSVTPRILCSTVPCPSLSDSLFEALAKWFSSKERNFQSLEKLARDQRKPLDYLVSIGNEVPINKRTSETGKSPAFMKRTVQEEMEQSSAVPSTFSDAVSHQWGAKDKGEAENLLRQRSIGIEYPIASSSNKVVTYNAGKHKDPTWTLMVGNIVEDSEDKHPSSTLRDLKRLKKSKDLIGLEYMVAKGFEAQSPSLCFRNRSQQSTNTDIHVAPLFCMLRQAFGFWHGRNQVTFESAHKIRQSLPLCRLSGNICKKNRMQGHFKVRRKRNQIKSSTFLKHLLEIVPKHNCKLINSVHLAIEPTVMENKVAVIRDQTPKQRANLTSLLDVSGASEHTKDPAVLERLSALASNLLVPSTNPQKFKLSVNSTDLFSLTEKNSQLRRKKLLDVFSWVNVKLNSRWAKGNKYSAKMFNSQSLALNPVQSTNSSVLEPSNGIPLAFCTPKFPLAFNIQMCSSSLRSTVGIMSLHSVTNRVALGEPETLQPAKWTFSFLLSQSSLGQSPVHEGSCVPTESCTASASLHAAKDSRRYAVAKKSSGCSMFGLQTVLALSSPGCYRFWTRERNLTSQIPTVQRLTVLQFAQGLKGLKCSSSVSADLFSSLPYLLGRVLSIWSQHGPSTCPSEFTPLHSNHCKWQPVTTATTSLGLGNSSAMLPHVPDQAVDVPRIVCDELRLEPYFSASLPTSCSIPEPEHSLLGDLASEFQVRSLDDVSVPALPTSGAQLEKAKLEKRPKKVSQIRIRKTVPKPDPNLTPMGLPRPKRLKKKEFSLEEIYTNKNYKSPPATRCLETIFEEPKEKNGCLISVSHQKRKRILEFQDFTIPRKRKARSRVKVMGSFTRAQKAALEGRELDALLIQKLTDLETFFAMEEEQEQGHALGS
ncbi:protein PRR14L isoform X2 [Paroedura picta]|uniref:protein PRR14L isoform X2 n=1 Tax=Paroedura picta TaxID=143630 RepID=UPI0040562DA4